MTLKTKMIFLKGKELNIYSILFIQAIFHSHQMLMRECLHYRGIRANKCRKNNTVGKNHHFATSNEIMDLNSKH